MSLSKLATLHIPDAIPTPGQWADDLRRTEHDAEARLAFAVLEDGIACLVHRHAPTKRAAWKWLESRAEGIYTFESLCGIFGIDAGSVREKLRLNPRVSIPRTSNVTVVKTLSMAPERRRGRRLSGTLAAE